MVEQGERDAFCVESELDALMPLLPAEVACSMLGGDSPRGSSRGHKVGVWSGTGGWGLRSPHVPTIIIISVSPVVLV